MYLEKPHFNYMLSTRDSFKNQSKRIEKIFHVKITKREREILGYTNIRQNRLLQQTRELFDKEGHYILMKGSNHEEHTTITTRMHQTTEHGRKYKKQTLIELKGETVLQ